jgi:hypothetical protein
MLFRLRTLRLWGLTKPLWLYIFIVLLLLTFWLHESSFPNHSFFFGTNAKWDGFEGTGCPPQPAITVVGQESNSKFASLLSPAKLLCRPLASDISAVPKLLHQTCKSTELPSKFESWSKVCREEHNDWEWVLWTDEDNLTLVRKYFPWLEDTYLALPGDIYRVDLVRNMYMYIFGG